MRSQEQRDEQTLDIMSAVLVGAVLFLLIAALVWGAVRLTGVEPDPEASTLVPALVIVYFAAVALRLRHRRRQ